MTHPLAVARRFRRRDRGSAAVEFALVVPFLLIIVFGMIDMSRAYYTINQLVTAVREGARYAAVLEDPAARADSVRAVVQRSGTSLGSGAIQASQIDVTFDQPNATVTVTVRNYPFQVITPLAAVIGKSSITLTRSATFRWERA